MLDIENAFLNELPEVSLPRSTVYAIERSIRHSSFFVLEMRCTYQPPISFSEFALLIPRVLLNHLSLQHFHFHIHHRIDLRHKLFKSGLRTGERSSTDLHDHHVHPRHNTPIGYKAMCGRNRTGRQKSKFCMPWDQVSPISAYS